MLLQLLSEVISQALDDLYHYKTSAKEVSIEPTAKNQKGDFTFVVFPYVKKLQQNPEKLGNEIGNYLIHKLEIIESFEVLKGFLNIALKDKFWLDIIQNFELENPGKHDDGATKKVLIEYSSPNTNKPQHLGHVRNNLLGYSLSKILEKGGYQVVKANLINDRGIHICKSMLAWEKFGNGETPESSGIKGDHLVGKYYVLSDKIYREEVSDLMEQGIAEELAKKQAPFLVEAQEMLKKWEDGDAHVNSIWKMMNSWVYDGFHQTYARMGVSFDRFYYESDTYLLGKEIVQEGLEKEVFFKKFNGSVWVDLTREGLDEKLLLRADGTSVYITQDLGTAELKNRDYAPDHSIYVVGNEQDYHFKVLTLILKKLQKDYADTIYHLSYGMVDLPSGRMKTREGTVVDADQLMDEMYETARQRTEELGKTEGMNDAEKQHLFEMIGMGALKYFLLKVDPVKRMLFDPNESIDFQGNTASFIQYTHARIKSVLRGANIEIRTSEFREFELLAEEKEVVRFLNLYTSRCREAARQYAPSVIAAYAYDLAKLYNRFYHECSILGEPDVNRKSFRLQLSLATASVLKDAMGLLGIEVPEKM